MVAILAAIKSALLLLTGFSVHRSLSPPNPSVKREECAGEDTPFEKYIQYVTLTSKIMVWVAVFCEITTILAVEQYTAGNLCPLGNAQPTALKVIHPTMIMGAFAALLGAELRLWCFKALGQNFTFEVIIRPGHELITTGPYAWVRHPSYTGIFLTLLGATCVICSPGSALFRCGGLWNYGGRIWLGLWTAKCLVVFKGTIKRLGVEDQLLRVSFGGRWNDYERKVPKKLIPGVL